MEKEGIHGAIMEVYSPPRVTATARRHPRLGIIPGIALDLTVNDETGAPWNFSIPAQRAKAERLLDEQKPLLLIGSLMIFLNDSPSSSRSLI